MKYQVLCRGLGVVVALLGLPISAQTLIGGAQSGTLGSGVYHTTSNLTVALGQTWTLQAGVVIKFTGGGTHSLTVNGTLIANGLAGNPVIFTDDADDSAGGDTNFNGPSTGSPASWEGILFTGQGSSASVIQHADIRFGGGTSISNLELNNTNATFTNCIIRDCLTHGMDLNSNSRPTVTGCQFISNGGYAIERAPIAALANTTSNTAHGNGINSIHVTSATVSQSLSLNASSNLSGGVLFGVPVSISSSATLTLGAGVIWKFDAPSIGVTVGGTLIANGTALSPVILTDDADDSAGGDTDTTGMSSGVASSWQGILFSGSISSASNLSFAEIRFGGSSSASNIELGSSNPTFTNCTIRNSLTDGMDLNNSSIPTVRNCQFVSNGGAAITGSPIAALENFSYNTATGNGLNSVRITQGFVNTNVSIGAQAMVGGGVISSTNINVGSTGTLNLGPGVIIKFESVTNFVHVIGSLNFRGTSYEPVVLTEDNDDAFGGDTNTNGPSVGSPASWQGIVIIAASSGSSVLESVRIRFAGGSSMPALTCDSPLALFKAVRADSGFGRGLVFGAMAAGSANLVAHACGDHGIHLTGGSVDLVHATVSNCPTGIRREAAYTGRIRNSISFGNTTNFSNFGTGTSVFNSCGGFGGTNGNTDSSPQFISQAAGDFHLQAASPCIDTADLAVALPVAKDHDENSRGLDAALVGLPFPDMGAFEFALWDMTVTGEPRLGRDLEFTMIGPTGSSTYFLGALDGSIAITPYGVMNAGAIPFVTVIPITGFLPVGSTYRLSVPNDPGIVGVSVGIQTITVPFIGATVGHFTRLYRGTVRP